MPLSMSHANRLSLFSALAGLTSKPLPSPKEEKFVCPEGLFQLIGVVGVVVTCGVVIVYESIRVPPF